MLSLRDRVKVINRVTYSIEDDITFDLYLKTGTIIGINEGFKTEYKVLFTIAECIKLKVSIPASSLVKEDHELCNWWNNE